MSKKIGIIDEPLDPGKDDHLDIKIHSEALIEFIEKTNTPITIGIQGVWGSGKTSLLNSINHHFAEKNKKFLQIQINAWETSLLSTPEESLIKIIHEIIDGLTAGDTDQGRKKAIKSGAKKILRGALRIGATATLGLKAGDVTEEIWKETENSIKQLREDLKEQVESLRTRSTNPYENVIIYVDDLDRIVPKNAVAILELLKNIFNVPHCIFVLAIDYQVVVKGLETKFGKRTAENEREFRAFFDKIIQLPFMMPMDQYNIGNYANELLKEISFTEATLKNEELEEILFLSIGQNPRSLKRMVNSLALIEIFKEKKIKLSNISDSNDKNKRLAEDEEKLLLFALVCLQVEFPYIHNLLQKNHDFQNWDNEFAFTETQNAEGDSEKHPNFQRELKGFKEHNSEVTFIEPLYRICYIKPELKARFSDIKNLLLYIKNNFLSDEEVEISSLLKHALDQTSVTSVATTDQPEKINKNKSGAKSNSQKKIAIEISKKFAAKLKDSNIFNDLSDEGNAYAARREEPLLKGKDTLWKVKYELNFQPGFKILLTCEDVSDFSEPTKIMDKLKEKRELIEEKFGCKLIWEYNQNPTKRNKSHKISIDYAWVKKMEHKEAKDLPDLNSTQSNILENEIESYVAFYDTFVLKLENIIRIFLKDIIQTE